MNHAPKPPARTRVARGLIDLVHDGVDQMTDLAERTHDGVVERSARLCEPIEPARKAARLVSGVHKAISGGVFHSIRAINRLARAGTTRVADSAEARFDQSRVGGWQATYLQPILNGFWGDHLNRRDNGLDLGMTLRDQGRTVPVTRQALAAVVPAPTAKIALFVHGLASTESLWGLFSGEHYGDDDVTFGSRLRDDLGFTPLYLRYNSGRHISENGRALSDLLAGLIAAFPVPIDEIALIGHSMGGLVARSAAHDASLHDEPWITRLRHVACIGSPHLGAPLEKAANLVSTALKSVDVAGTQVPAGVLDSRSAGIKDLRHGFTDDEEWAGKDPDAWGADDRQVAPPVEGVGYYYLAATLAKTPDHPLGRLVGDLLVRLPSATGEAAAPERRVRFARGAVFPGMNHFHLAGHPDVYQALRDMLEAGPRGRSDQGDS